MHVHTLHGPVQILLIRRQHDEIVLGGGRHGLQGDLQWVAVHPVPQVKQLHAHLGVGQELLADIALAQVLAHGVVVGEVTVVHQGFVQADEGMRPTRMPYPPFGGVALVGNPHAGALVFQLVILHHLLGVAHDLEHRKVPPVAEHKGTLLSQTGVEGVVQTVGVLVDELVLHGAWRQVLQALFRRKLG